MVNRPCKQANSTPMDWVVSTTGRREMGVSWENSCSVSSVVDVEVKPLIRSCWSPENPIHLSWPWIFSNFSRYSCFSREIWASSLPSNRNAIWYSNSKSDSMRDTAAQKMVARRLRGWLALEWFMESRSSVQEVEEWERSLDRFPWRR